MNWTEITIAALAMFSVVLSLVSLMRPGEKAVLSSQTRVNETVYERLNSTNDRINILTDAMQKVAAAADTNFAHDRMRITTLDEWVDAFVAEANGIDEVVNKRLDALETWQAEADPVLDHQADYMDVACTAIEDRLDQIEEYLTAPNCKNLRLAEPRLIVRNGRAADQWIEQSGIFPSVSTIEGCVWFKWVPEYKRPHVRIPYELIKPIWDRITGGCYLTSYEAMADLRQAVKSCLADGIELPHVHRDRPSA